MFKRENRLVGNVRFNNSYFFSTPLFVLKEKRNKLNLNRFGIVVSKKIDKRAVARNKIKRIFRDSLIKLNMNMTIGHDMLYITKTGIIGKTTEEISLLIGESMQKAGFIKKEK